MTSPLATLALRIVVFAAYLFLYIPIAVVIVMSLNDSRTNTLPWGGFTAQWYREAVGNPDLWASFLRSLELGVLTTAITVLLATSLCLAFRGEFPFKRVALYLVLLPMLVPSIVHAVSVILFWRILKLDLTVFGSGLVGHVTYVLPFAFLTIFPRVHRFNESLEEAARDLGASEWIVFRRIVLPLILPGIVSGALLSFLMSFDEFIRSLLLIANTSTLPMYLWSRVSYDLSPQPNAVSAIMVGFTAVILCVWLLVQRKS